MAGRPPVPAEPIPMSQVPVPPPPARPAASQNPQPPRPREPECKRSSGQQPLVVHPPVPPSDGCRVLFVSSLQPELQQHNPHKGPDKILLLRSVLISNNNNNKSNPGMCRFLYSFSATHSSLVSSPPQKQQPTLSSEKPKRKRQSSENEEANWWRWRRGCCYPQTHETSNSH